MSQEYVALRWPSNVPRTEYSELFLQGMLDRMAQAFFKYGAMADAYPDKIDAIESMEKRMRNYAKDGNKEWLMDAGNFLMIEFGHPRHSGAHYRPTTTQESPGRKWHGETDASTRGNKEF